LDADDKTERAIVTEYTSIGRLVFDLSGERGVIVRRGAFPATRAIVDCLVAWRGLAKPLEFLHGAKRFGLVSC